MGVDALGDARPLRRFPARFPNDFRGDRFDVGAIRRFNGKGFADLFADDARIIFDGCQVGAGAKGRDFVKEVARVFLSTGGGRASARSEFVLSAPIFTSESLLALTSVEGVVVINVYVAVVASIAWYVCSLV